MNRFIILGVLFLLVSCGTQRQIYKKYTGKPEALLQEDFGTPKSVLEKGGEKIYVFEEIKELKGTEISQGKLTLDPMVTPKVKKTERYIFTVKEGIVIKTRYEEEYER